MRPRNIEWNVEPNPDGHYGWDQVTAALLMDIRDELRALNMRLSCGNLSRLQRTLSRISGHVSRLPPKRRKPHARP